MMIDFKEKLRQKHINKMIDFKALAKALKKADLLNKSFMDMNKGEINGLCEIIHSCTNSEAGFTPPYIDGQGRLVIPLLAPVKYRWWQGGQSIQETLEEIGASDEIKARYIPTGFGNGLKKS